MNNINWDDKLTLYYYNDGLTADERQAIADALREDADLAAHYETLGRQLDGLADDAPTRTPRHAVARWHDSIDRADERRRISRATPDTRFHIPSFLWGGAVTAALVVGVGIGVLISGDPAAPPAGTGDAEFDSGTAAFLPARSRTAFSRGLQVHLRDSRQDIASLTVAGDADRALLISNLIEQNRLFERAAEHSDSPELARVLRAFEPILMQLAAEDIAPRDAEVLRSQLEFELNVVLTKLARDESEQSQSI